MNWIVTLVVGGVIGWLASMLMKTDKQMGIFRLAERPEQPVWAVWAPGFGPGSTCRRRGDTRWTSPGRLR
jgi:hypothetical protein